LFFGSKQAAVTLADCDRYKDWRLSGGFADAEPMKCESEGRPDEKGDAKR
jgi:hypothetical protein